MLLNVTKVKGEQDVALNQSKNLAELMLEVFSLHLYSKMNQNKNPYA